MSYTACAVVSGTARVTDVAELAELAWCTRSEILECVPFGFYEPVQAYLDGELAR